MNFNRNRAGTINRNECGGALVTVIVLVAVVASLAGIALTYTVSSVNEVEHQRKEIQALLSAEAGVNASLGQLAVSWRTGQPVAAALGSEEQPDGNWQNRYYTTIEANPDETFTILSTGVAGSGRRSVEVVARMTLPSPFDHSLYAGNLSEDPTYVLRLNGYGSQADTVTGKLFSGGDIMIDEDATVAGSLTSSGTITGAIGKSGVTSKIPQLLEIDYELYHDFDVAALFEDASVQSDNAGGSAGQLPASSPAHIFRKNPSDRTSNTNATVKDDYFLEDPYETVRADYPQDGTEAFLVSLPEEANNRLFFIDGNLWLHNRMTYSLKIKNDGADPTNVTFVVKGNVYFSDNFFYDNPDESGVAFVALSDPEVEDSGNIYFGDPSFGTMQYAEAFMFAENNFYDNNLDASGSTNVAIRGAMTAGNHVDIQRDYLKSDGSIAHTQLKLTFDPRQLESKICLPGIPTQQDQQNAFEVAYWREVPTPSNAAPAAETVEVQQPLVVSSGEEAGEQPEKVDLDEVDLEDIADTDWRLRWAVQGKPWKVKKRENPWEQKKAEQEEAKKQELQLERELDKLLRQVDNVETNIEKLEAQIANEKNPDIAESLRLDLEVHEHELGNLEIEIAAMEEALEQ